ncbi:choice-of-anchor D domain-containing protein, partial [bacterium]|nr:choice-of-anchor D domain-containing protein [bacterium]
TLAGSTGTIRNNGSGALTLSGNTIFSGSGARTITLGGAQSGDNTFSGIISNNSNANEATALTKSDAGKWILSNSNTYTGVTTISSGTLSVSSIGNGGVAGNLGQASNAASNLVISGGTLQYTGSGETTNRAIKFGVSGTTLDASGSGAIVFSSSSADFTDSLNSSRTFTLTGTSTANNQFAGVIANAGTGATAITKTGAGKWILSGTNTTTGVVKIDAGTLSVSSIGNGGVAGGLGQQSNAAANLIISVGTLQYTGSGETTDRAITFGGVSGVTPTIDASGTGALILSASAHAYGSVTARTITLTGSSTNNNEIQGVIANGSSGNNSIVKTGAGKWVLSGTNTFTNGVTINAGTLSVASIGNGGIAGNLGQSSTTAANLTLGGGTLQYTGNTNSTDRNFVLTASTASTIDVSTAGQTLTMSGASTNTSGSLTKVGAGTLALSGANLHTGGTTVSAGTLRAITSTGALGNGTLTLSGGNLELAGDAGVNFARNTTVSSNTTITSDRVTASSAGVTHTLGTLSIGAQTLTTARGSNASTGTGGITFGATTLTGNATLSTGANTLLTLGAVGGNFSMTKSGTGSLTFTGANTSTGDLNISGGTVTVNSGSSLSNNNITVGTAGSSGAVLNVSAITPTFTSSQKIGGIGTINATGKTVTVGGTWAPGNSIGSNTVTGNLTITGTSQMELGTAGASRTSPGTSDYTDVSGNLVLSNSTISLIDNAGANSNGSLGAGAYRLFTYGSGANAGSNITVSALADSTKRAAIVDAGFGPGSGKGVFAEVYNLASAAATQTVDVGAYRVGASKSGTASITNASAVNATYTEQLATGTITPGTGATSSGSFSGVAGGSSGNITVGLGTASTAGAKSGTVTVGLNSTAVNSSGLANQAITSQVITVNGAAYDTANAGYATTTKAFGNVRVGSSPAQQTVSFTNNAITNASYQDSLDVSGSKTNSKITLGNGFNVAAGASAKNLTVDASTTTAGSLADTITLSLTSNANSVSGLSNSSITPTGTIAVTGNVYDYAQANYDGASLDFGYVHKGASVSNQNVAIGNKTITNASYQDLLDVSGTSTSGLISVTGFNGLAASTNGATTDNLVVGVDSSTVGSLAGTVNLTLTSNANGVSGLSNGTATRSGTGSITTSGAVYSGLGTWATNGSGSWGTFASGFGSNWGSNEGSPGLDAGFTNTDTATFGSAITSNATVSLNGASPKLKSITFNNTSASYTLAQGSSGNITLNAGTGDSAATIDVTGNHEISAVLAGSSAVNKTGTGNLTLSGVNTYSGQTNVNAGTLTLKNSGALAGNVSVASAATLAANNSGTANGVAGNLTLASGGTI